MNLRQGKVNCVSGDECGDGNGENGWGGGHTLREYPTKLFGMRVPTHPTPSHSIRCTVQRRPE